MNKNVKDELKNIGRDAASEVLQEATPIVVKGFWGLLKRIFSKKARQAYRRANR